MDTAIKKPSQPQEFRENTWRILESESLVFGVFLNLLEEKMS